MATIHFVDANNNIRQAYSFSSQVAPWCIAVCDQNGTKCYIPTDGSGYTTYDEDMGSYINRYSYSSSIPSLHAVYAGGTVANAYNTVSTISKVSIPDGTYDPATFERLVANYVSLNSGRWADVGAGLFRVNNQTVQIKNNEGKAFIYYGTVSIGSGVYGTYRFISISATGDLNEPQVKDLTNWGGCYIVYGTSPFQSYANYPISIFGGSSIAFL